MKTMRHILTMLMLSILMIFSSMVSANASIPMSVNNPPKSPIIDGADLFSPDQEATLTEAITRSREQYDLSFVVESITTLDGQPLEAVSLARANELGVGDSGKNNGVFILISRDDHQVRFELGSGVSYKVSDAAVTNIINSNVTPAFKQGDYTGGVQAGMAAVGSEYINPGKDYTQLPYILGGVILLPLIIIIIITLFGSPKKRREEKMHFTHDRLMRASIRRLEVITQFANELRYSPDATAYKALPNEEARINWIKERNPKVAETLVRHYTAPPMYESHRPKNPFDEEPKPFPSTIIIDRKFYDSAHGFFSSFTDKKADSAVRSYKLIGKGFEKMSINEANDRIQKEKDRYNKAREKERRRREKAEKLWHSLPASKRKTFESAKTRKELDRLIAAETNEELTGFLPLITNLIFSSGSSSRSSGSSYNDSGSSSRSSSSSNSSTSSYDSGSSFGGGGSFDGGGGSGSW